MTWFTVGSFLQGARGHAGLGPFLPPSCLLVFALDPRPLLSHAEGPVAPTSPPGNKPTGKRLPGVGQETRRAQGENGLLFLIYGPEQVERSKQEAAPALEIPERAISF